jgi:hypothetical protein
MRTVPWGPKEQGSNPEHLLSLAARDSPNGCCGSWPCKNTFPGEGGETAGPVRPQATIAAISGLVPTMFMTRVKL